MVFQDVIFWVLAVASVGAALGVVLLKDIFRAALLLVVVFLAVAGLFVMMNAEFLAVVQVLIYAGAIAILIIFAITLTRDVQRGNLPNRLQPAAVLFPALLLVALVFVAVDTNWNLIASEDEPIPQEAHLQEQFVKDQVIRRAVELLQASTVSGMPEDWRETLEGNIQRDINEATDRAEEQRRAGQLEKAQQSAQEAEIAVSQLAFLEKARFLFSVGLEFQSDLEQGVLSTGVRQEFENVEISLSDDVSDVTITEKVKGSKWQIKDRGQVYTVTKKDEALNIYETGLNNAEERSGIGDLLTNDFVLPFEIASVLLLAAIIGALVMVRER